MASLMDLPIELVQEIGALLPLEAFRATRLTCKRLHSKLWDTFAKRFFRTATVHIIESDLNKLLDIARSDFGQHVQELIVEVDEDSIISILGKDAFGLKEGASANFYESGAEEAVVLSKESAEGFNAFLQEKQDTFARNQHVQLLRQALTSLPGLEALRLSDRGRTRFGQDVYALGGAAVTHLAGVDGRSDLHQHYAAYQRHHHPLRILTASLEGAVVNIQDLYLEFTVDQDLEPLCESFSSSMLKVRKFVIDLQFSRRYLKCTAIDTYEFPMVFDNVGKPKLLPPTNLLQEIHVRDSWWVYPGLSTRNHTTSFFLPQLSLIHIYKTKAQTASLKTALGNLQDTLTCVQLSAVMLVDGGWHSVFAYISDFGPLKQVCCHRLDRVSDDPVWKCPIGLPLFHRDLRVDENDVRIRQRFTASTLQAQLHDMISERNRTEGYLEWILERKGKVLKICRDGQEYPTANHDHDTEQDDVEVLDRELAP